MYVSFPVTARELLEVLKSSEARGRDPRSVEVKLRLPDGSIYGKAGKINFLDVEVDPTTDTVTVRATIPNTSAARSERILIANELVGVIIEETEPNKPSSFRRRRSPSTRRGHTCWSSVRMARPSNAGSAQGASRAARSL